MAKKRTNEGVRTLVLNHTVTKDSLGTYNSITSLYCKPDEEAIYAQWDCSEQDKPDTIELTTHVDEMIRIRDWLNNRIEKVVGDETEYNEWKKNMKEKVEV